MDFDTKRYLHTCLVEDLKEKMIMLSGPRQVGKTTLAQRVGAGDFAPYQYLNWDVRADKKNIIAHTFLPEKKLIIFDEIHKYKQWKNYVKGEYDKYKNEYAILVTGSARLDVYRRGGDSLMGRYHYYRLHPFSLREVTIIENLHLIPYKPLVFFSSRQTSEAFKQLWTFGGFPEPFLRAEQRTLRRWHNQRIERLVREDIRDVENVRDLSALEVLAELLPSRVGSLLSLNALREDINVTHKTVALWMDILERFYYHFRIYPFASHTIKSLRKEPKLYLWDWSEIQDEGARLENIVASHLLKMCHYLHDREGYKAELYFLRDREAREVDFLVAIDKKPWFAVEVKTTRDTRLSALHYFGAKLHIPFLFHVVKENGIDVVKDTVRIMSVDRFLSGLV